MTKEEIKKVLDLALEYYKLEIFGTGKESQPPTQERIDYIYDRMQQFLPSDLDEAARKYGHEEPILPEDYNDGDIPLYESWTADAFKSGAEWMAGQGETIFDTVDIDGQGQRWITDNLLQGDYDCGEEVIIQIRKKQ